MSEICNYWNNIFEMNDIWIFILYIFIFYYSNNINGKYLFET